MESVRENTTPFEDDVKGERRRVAWRNTCRSGADTSLTRAKSLSAMRALIMSTTHRRHRRPQDEA